MPDIARDHDPASEEFPDLSCPGCGSDLAWDDLFLSHRVCGTCRRHFFISARERLALVLPNTGFRETNEEVSRIPSVEGDDQGTLVPSSAQRLADSRERDLINDAVVTGTGRMGSEEAVFAFLDEHATGTTIGALTAEKIILAMELAAHRRLPFVMFVAGGNASTSSGPLSLAQPTRIAAAGAQLHLAGIPTVAVLCQSASSGLVGALAGQCDFVIAEPGTRVWDRRHRAAAGVGGSELVEEMRARGIIDQVVDREQQNAWLGNLLDLFGRRGTSLRSVGRATRSRHEAAEPLDAETAQPARGFLSQIVEFRIEIGGDRSQGDAPGVIAGFGRAGGQTVGYVAFDRAEASASGDVDAVRKVIRLVGLASRLDVPVLTLVGHDTPMPMNSAEAMAIAKLSGVLTVAPVPMVSAVVGDVQSSLARALASGDRVLCLEGATFGIEGITPGPGRLAAGRGRNALTSGEALLFGLIEEVVPARVRTEPGSGDANARALREAVESALLDLGGTGSRRRIVDRQRKIRSLGQSTPAGRAALRDELTDWREWQHTIARSVGDWRERWDQLRSTQPRFTVQRPDLGDLANRLRARRAELLERAGRADRTLR
jgi:acetyl-CoA carboxylase carboxyl transferase subunit beta